MAECVRGLLVALALPVALLGCTGQQGGENGLMAIETPSAAEQATGQSAGQPFPDVIGAELVVVGDGVYDVTVTISSPYDTAERYADGWRVLGPDGTMYGEHQLLHDHASEQPFTRTQRGVRIPAGVSQVSVEGRDRLNGYGGQTVLVDVPTTTAG